MLQHHKLVMKRGMMTWTPFNKVLSLRGLPNFFFTTWVDKPWLSCVGPHLCTLWHHGVSYFTHSTGSVMCLHAPTPRPTTCTVHIPPTPMWWRPNPKYLPPWPDWPAAPPPRSTARDSEEGESVRGRVCDREHKKMTVDIWGGLTVSLTHEATWIRTMNEYGDRWQTELEGSAWGLWIKIQDRTISAGRLDSTRLCHSLTTAG